MKKGEPNTPKEPKSLSKSLSKSEREELLDYRQAKEDINDEYLTWRYYQKHLGPKIQEAKEQGNDNEVERLRKAVRVTLGELLKSCRFYFDIGDEEDIQQLLRDMEKVGPKFKDYDWPQIDELIEKGEDVDLT